MPSQVPIPTHGRTDWKECRNYSGIRYHGHDIYYVKDRRIYLVTCYSKTEQPRFDSIVQRHARKLDSSEYVAPAGVTKTLILPQAPV